MDQAELSGREREPRYPMAVGHHTLVDTRAARANADTGDGPTEGIPRREANDGRPPVLQGSGLGDQRVAAVAGDGAV